MVNVDCLDCRMILMGMHQTKIFLTWTVLISSVGFASYAEDQTNLKFVNVLFRHGDRTPDPPEMYPKDPYYFHNFEPWGLGELTNDGKLRVYELGQVLRERYDDFLGELYEPDSLLAVTTDYKRTKMCLQIVLAAIYPPKGNQQWNKHLNWQPIPMTYVPSRQDWLLIPEECPEYLAARMEVENSAEVLEKYEKFRGFMGNLTKWTGKNITISNDFNRLYHMLTAESAMNLKLPDWTNDVFPDGKLLDGIFLDYEIFSYTQYMRRINGGKMLYRLIEYLMAVREGTNKGLKFVLYSGHETNMVALQQTLGTYEYHVPQYSSASIIELHEKNNQYYVKVLYYRGIPPDMEVQQIPGCEVLCPLDQFIELLSDVTPSADELLCDKSNVETYESRMADKMNATLSNHI